MREHPIIFSAPMVRAILAGVKTQTRRVIKPQPEFIASSARWFWPKNNATSASREWWEYMNTLGMCPYGSPGDRLWVREKTAIYGPCVLTNNPLDRVRYCADDGGPWTKPDYKIVPSIHMPRWASRLTLEITNVRVERVQDISDADAKAEGVQDEGGVWKDYQLRTLNGCETARLSFKSLWDSINAKRGFGWDTNPHVWVIEFKRLEKSK